MLLQRVERKQQHLRSKSAGTIETNKLKNIDDNDVILDAVIVGAGWAGLGAARMLAAKGDGTGANFVILEGRSYIGGRSRTVPICTSNGDNNKDPVAKPVTVELGSQWVCGASPENPVYEVALEAGVGVRVTDEKLEGWSDTVGVFYEKNSSPEGSEAGGKGPRQVPNEFLEDTYNRDFMRGFVRYQTPRQYAARLFGGDRSLRSAVDGYVEKKSRSRLKGERRLAFENVLETIVAKSYGADLEDMSLRWWDWDDELPGGDSLLAQGAGKGFSGVVEHFAKPVEDKIRLQSKVTSIDWTENDTIVIKYSDQSGVSKQLKTRTVIITVPLGVLQSRSITFVPELPAKKLEAIDALGMGLYNKVILRWDEDEVLPWPDKIEWIGRLFSLTEKGKWSDFHNEKSITGQNIIGAIATGREAERVEKLSNEEIKNEVLSTLRSMFGDDAVPEPKQVLVTRWKDDEFSRGSFSYYKVGSTPKHREQLKETVDGRLFFAGEATHLEYFGMTHGALMSGEKAGKKALRKLRKRI